MDHESLFDCSWTWMPYNYGYDCTACTAFFLDATTMESGWINTNCSRRFHLPCKSSNGSYHVTRHYYHIPNTGDGDELCPSDTVFDLPLYPKDGYKLALQMWRHGLSHVWLPRKPNHTCINTVSSISCGDPGTPENGELIGQEYSFDGMVKYRCNTGWNLVGDRTRTCAANGSWTNQTPTCQKVNCGMAHRPKLAKSYGRATYYGDKFGYTCLWGHVFQGEPSLAYIVTVCQDDGAWSITVPDCIRKTCEVSTWSMWSECSVTCDQGVQTRRRQVVSHNNNINGDCPSLEEKKGCNVRSCDTCTATAYTVVLEIDTCRSALPVTNRYCTGTCKGKKMCCKPTKKSSQWVVLFCDDSRPRNFNLPTVEECGCVSCPDKR